MNFLWPRENDAANKIIQDDFVQRLLIFLLNLSADGPLLIQNQKKSFLKD